MVHKTNNTLNLKIHHKSKTTLNSEKKEDTKLQAIHHNIQID